MSSIPAVSGSSPVSQCFSRLASRLSCSHQADAVFRRVYINKLDDKGQIKTYEIKDKTGAVVRKTQVLTYIEDTTTGNLYLDEPEDLIRFKCSIIFLGLPFYTVGMMAWKFSKSLMLTAAIACDALKQLGEGLLEGKGLQAVEAFGRTVEPIPATVVKGIWGVVSSPLYGIGSWFSVLYGLVDPYQGRKLEGIFENAWQDGTFYREDFTRIAARPNETCLEACLKDLRHARGFYLANCFQVRGNTSDTRHIRVLQTKPV